MNVAASARWFEPATEDASRGGTVNWPALRWVLLAAFVFRVILGFATDTWAHADELFQYLEQAHRLVFGYGWRPWEYDYGIRSYVIPGFIALLLQPFKLTGLDSPFIYQPVLEVVFSAISLVMPYSMYRISRALFSERVARFTLLFGCFWWEIAVIGHRPLADAFAMYALFGTLALVLQPPNRKVIAIAGLLAGLTLVLRFQLLPVTGIVCLVALLRWRTQVWLMAPGFAMMVLLGGALDYYAWGVWFSSAITNYTLNQSHGVAAEFGSHPLYWYVWLMIISSGGLCIAGYAGLGLAWRKAWPLIGIAAVQMAFFSIVAHKELRYVMPAMPCWVFGAAILADRASGFTWVAAKVRPYLASALALVMAAVSAIGLADALPRQYELFSPSPIAQSEARQAYRFLSTQPDTKAILDLVNPLPWDMGGYYDLHRNAPIYLAIKSEGGFAYSGGGDAALAEPLKYVSHIIRPTAASSTEGFATLATFGDVTIDRRIVPASDLPVAEGFDYRVRPGVPLPPPTVTPRW